MKIRRDIAAGVFFSVIGLSALLMGLQYPIGTTFSMGPGYFPTIVSALMLILGLTLSVRSIRAADGPLLADIAWRPLIIILASVLGFALVIDRWGMIPALLVLGTVGWYANPQRSLKLLPAQLAVGVLVPVLIFRFGLNMPIPLWSF